MGPGPRRTAPRFGIAEAHAGARSAASGSGHMARRPAGAEGPKGYRGAEAVAADRRDAQAGSSPGPGSFPLLARPGSDSDAASLSYHERRIPPQGVRAAVLSV